MFDYSFLSTPALFASIGYEKGAKDSDWLIVMNANLAPVHIELNHGLQSMAFWSAAMGLRKRLGILGAATIFRTCEIWSFGINSRILLQHRQARSGLWTRQLWQRSFKAGHPIPEG